MLKVSFITTVAHNIGDDFVREGIIYLLEEALGPIQQQLIHKQIPLTARPEWDWFYRSGLLGRFDKIPGISGSGLARRIDTLLPINPRSDKVINCDLLVQSGAPIVWSNADGSCANNDWFDPLIRRRWRNSQDRIPFLNIAGGACQAYCSDGSEFAGAHKILDYLRELYGICALTTVRDELTLKIMRLVGAQPLLLPCPSIFARFRHHVEPQPPSYVVLNYMPGAGHYLLSKDIDVKKWEAIFVRFANDLAKKEKCVLVCHNERELTVAQSLFPGFALFHSNNYSDYLHVYSRAKYGILNRVHGAFALGSFGRPAFVIGSDSRSKMSDMIGLRNLYVGELSSDLLWEAVDDLKRLSTTYPAVINTIQETAQATYVRCMRNVLVSSSIDR